MNSRIPEEVRAFLVECIGSVGQLELLFILYQNKHREWSAETISTEISLEHRPHPAMATKQMEHLYSKGILRKVNNFFSYSPRNEFINSKIEKLFQIYQDRPVSIVTVIFNQPEDKLKGFADAFKFKKD